MSSSFKVGLTTHDLFGSGPHRFSESRQGNYLAFDDFSGETGAVALLDFDVLVTGRLVADDDEDLWDLRDAITDLFSVPPPKGTLTDHHGREWEDVEFVRFEPADRVDRGRRVSMGYVATFRKFIGGL